MKKLKIMVSSVNRNLIGERRAISDLFSSEKYGFVELFGSNPYDTVSISESSGSATINMARDCDLFLLVLGTEYGMVTEEGKSATEVEYDAAIRDDPTKVLVFLKETSSDNDDKQNDFIQRVCDYDRGYFRTSFQYTHELQKIVEDSFWNWFISRAQIGTRQSYIEHFIRTIKENICIEGLRIYYQTTEEYAELTFCFYSRKLIYQVRNEDIMKNFWE